MQDPIVVVPIFATTVYESAGPLEAPSVPPFTLIVAVVFPAATVTAGAAGALGLHCANTVVVSKAVTEPPPA